MPYNHWPLKSGKTVDFAFGCTHKCFMHLKVALSIALLVVMELFLTDQFFTLLKRKIRDKIL